MTVKPLTNKDTGKRRHKSEYPQSLFAESFSNGFFTVDQDWIVKYWNKTTESLLGVQAKDIIGNNLWETFSASIPSDFYAVYHNAFLTDIPPHFEEFWTEMGAWFNVITYYCQNTLSVSFRSGSQPVRPEHPEQQLKTLIELYRSVIVVTSDCLWEWNLANKEFLWIDGGHKRVFGYQIENALIPQTFWESRVHPEDRERVLTRLNKIITQGTDSVWEDEYRFRRANGEYAHVHDRGQIIYDGNNCAIRIVGATQDITERKLTEDRL
ncbi:MAG TPA: PAS domain-containing protein [Puia sp.]|nr:PAS domain-containing protein [Puia sp.]